MRNKPGPDRSTTRIREEVFLKLMVDSKAYEPDPTPEQVMNARTVVCRDGERKEREQDKR